MIWYTDNLHPDDYWLRTIEIDARAFAAITQMV
jgi:hypothetical protein